VRLPSSGRYGFWLALLRIYAGAFWLMHGIPKFLQSQRFMPPDGMLGGYLSNAATQTTGFYHSFLANVVVPNINVFAELVRLGEVVTGCLLFLGFFTRFGGLLGVFLALNYLASKGGLSHAAAWSGIDAAAIALSAINVVLPTGRVLGIDALIGRSRAAQQKPAVTAGAAAPSRVEFVDEPPMNGPTAPR
jgi:uncharacterized membrane protein YphA (DoxX/SURF4 family)